MRTCPAWTRKINRIKQVSTLKLSLRFLVFHLLVDIRIPFLRSKFFLRFCFESYLDIQNLSHIAQPITKQNDNKSKRSGKGKGVDCARRAKTINNEILVLRPRQPNMCPKRQTIYWSPLMGHMTRKTRSLALTDYKTITVLFDIRPQIMRLRTSSWIDF